MPKAKKKTKKVRKALTSGDIPAHAEKRQAHKRARQRSERFEGKTFEVLTSKEKDVLFKMLAIRAGLLEDSGDQD